MAEKLRGKTVAIVVANRFEQIEMTTPRQALETEGAETYIVSPKKDEMRGWKHKEWGETFAVDVPIHQAQPEQFNALLLPSSVMNPDHLRLDHDALTFIRSFFDAGKPVAAICHAPWLLIDVSVVKG